MEKEAEEPKASCRERVGHPLFGEGRKNLKRGSPARFLARKLQRILASMLFSQRAKLNMTVFVLYLPSVLA